MISKNIYTPLAVVAVIFLATFERAYAHHSISPHYDVERQVTLEGVVTSFKFVSPHSFVYLDVTNADGTVVNWNCEMQASVILTHSGWTKDLFKVGTTVRIDGFAARRDPLGCAFSSGELEDGTVLGRGGVIVSAATAIATASSGDGNVPVKVSGVPTIYGHWRTAPHLRPNGDLVGDLISWPLDGQPPSEEDIGTAKNPLGIYAKYLTNAGREAAANFDMVYDDPALVCSGASIMRSWTEPNGISEITRDGDRVLIKHQYMDVVRTVYLNTKEDPSGIEPSMTGHSYGWFEGDKFIIDTAGFKAGVLFPHPGVLHSDQLQVREVLSLSADGGQLTREYLATDPLYFSEPIPGRVVWNRSDRPLLSFNCTELSGANNVRPDGN